MSRQIDLEKKLSKADRLYLQDRGRLRDIQQNDADFGDAEEPEPVRPDTPDPQAVPAATDATPIDGEGGVVDDGDWYDEDGTTVEMLKAEMASRNNDREPGDRISMAGNKAALIERLRADDAANTEE